MKRFLAAVVACSAVAAWGQAMTMQEARKRIPELAGLSDQSALNVIHQVYYPTMDKNDLASRLGVKIPEPQMPKTLGPIDKWRFESCQTDAAKAPTAQGVGAGLRVCREKFGQ